VAKAREYRTVKILYNTYRALKLVAAMRGVTMTALIDTLVKHEAERIEFNLPLDDEHLTKFGLGARLLQGR
jgi:hypothetical protein